MLSDIDGNRDRWFQEERWHDFHLSIPSGIVA